jgi:hypothetical protein
LQPLLVFFLIFCSFLLPIVGQGLVHVKRYSNLSTTLQPDSAKAYTALPLRSLKKRGGLPEIFCFSERQGSSIQ